MFVAGGVNLRKRRGEFFHLLFLKNLEEVACYMSTLPGLKKFFDLHSGG